MEEPKKQDKCLGKLDKTVGECYYNKVEGKKFQRKENELLCSHCWSLNKDNK